MAPSLTGELSRLTPHAEDIVADAFVELIGLLDRGRNIGNYGAMLRTIAERRAAKQYRGNDRRAAVEFPAGDAHDLAVLAAAHQQGGDVRLFTSAFDQSVRDLDEGDRDAYLLTELRGLSDREAADVLGTHFTTTNRRADRARSVIRKGIT